MHDFDIIVPRPQASRCRVRVGSGALERLVEDLVASPPGDRLFVIADDRVAPLYAAPLCTALRGRGSRVDLLTFPAGEASKTRGLKSTLEDRLLELGAARDSAVVAVGGGVTGDLAGFVAATWHRGVPLVQVPTSLVAMVDSALGGKTAVNLPAAKNIVGSFHQPWGIYADVGALSTLDSAYFAEGLAEVVKCAVVADVALFRWLERSAPAILAREVPALEHAVARCLALKARIVRHDEREVGRRAILNYGHTVGHAVEAASGFTVRHGAAVAVGLVVEGRLACAATGFPPAHLARIEALLAAFGLPLQPPPGSVRLDDVVAATRLDKKARDSRVHYALPRRIGSMLPGRAVTRTIDEGELRAAWSSPATRRSN